MSQDARRFDAIPDEETVAPFDATENDVGSVTLTATKTSFSVGEMASVTATVKDAGGVPLEGFTVEFASTDPTKVAAPTSGVTGPSGTVIRTVVALVAGGTTLTATSGGVASNDLPFSVATIPSAPTYEGQGSATVTITAESRLSGLFRVNPRRRTNADQQQTHPGDLYFAFVDKTTEKKVIWPAKEFFKR